MTQAMTRIAICAPSTPITREDAQRVTAAAQEFAGLALQFHEQCFAQDGHFAGADALRLAALLECANDPAFDAVWFARGGYGANRIAPAAIAGMDSAARGKTYLGYSDAGYLLAALYRAGIGQAGARADAGRHPPRWGRSGGAAGAGLSGGRSVRVWSLARWPPDCRLQSDDPGDAVRDRADARSCRPCGAWWRKCRSISMRSTGCSSTLRSSLAASPGCGSGG